MLYFFYKEDSIHTPVEANKNVKNWSNLFVTNVFPYSKTIIKDSENLARNFVAWIYKILNARDHLHWFYNIADLEIC